MAISASKGSSSSIRSFCAGLVSVLTTLISLDLGNYASARVFIDESGERYGMGKLRSTVELRFEGCRADGIAVVNLFGIPFYREVIFSGRPKSADRSVLSFEPGQWQQGELDLVNSSYYVEIVSGANAGILTDIDAVNEGLMRIETADDLSALLSSEDRVVIGRHHTLFSIFGDDNRLGLKPGVNRVEADELIVFDAVRQRPDVFFFSSNLGAWVNSARRNLRCPDLILYPGQGLFLRRKDRARILYVASGPVMERSVSILVQPGINVMADVQFRKPGDSRFAEALRQITEADPRPMRRASAVGTMASQLSSDGLYRLIAGRSRSWIQAVGLADEEMVNIVSKTACVLREPRQICAYLLTTPAGDQGDD